MEINIPIEFEKAINEMPFNKTVKKNSIKVYAALYHKSYLSNKHGYFSVPSSYLQTINSRYNKIIKYFIDKNLIKYYERMVEDPNDIFNNVTKKYYNTERGVCMKYKFLVNQYSGRKIDVDMVCHKSERWYDITKTSLLDYGYEDINIKRDSFGRRLHHSGIRNYKKDFKGYCCIDAVTSQPRLLYNYLKENNIVDDKYYDIFENNKDFYKELVYNLNIDSRDEAKELFMFWINSKGYVPDFNINKLFPTVSNFIKKYKTGSYKDVASLLQRKESKMWIDDILNNIPTNWALTIHDSVLVKPEDGESVLKYIQDKYPNMKFEKKIL